MFMQQWFKRAKDKLTPARLEQARLHSLERFQFHEGEAIEADYQEFCENLALYLYKTNQSTALYQRRWTISEKGRRLQSHELDRFFKTSDPGVHWSCEVVRSLRKVITVTAIFINPFGNILWLVAFIGSSVAVLCLGKHIMKLISR